MNNCKICNGKGYIKYYNNNTYIYDLCECKYNISNQLKKRFVKDFNLPISIFRNDLFKYYIEELDEILDTKKKFIIFLDWINSLSEIEKNDIQTYLYDKLQKAIIKFKKTEMFKFFNSLDLSNFKVLTNIKQDNIYKPEYANNDFLSIDLKKANLQAVLIQELIAKQNKFIGKYRNIDKKYKEFIDKYLEPSNDKEKTYFINSKYIRQYLFGNLNPKRQQKIQKYFISLIANKIKNETNEEIISASNDEIVIKNPKNLNKLEQILEEIKFVNYLDLNINKFKLFQVDNFK